MSLLRRRAPRLVVRCPCGTSTPVAAGAIVECPCGRRWDTADVPDQELDGVSRVLRRSRARRLVFIVNLLLVAAALVLLGRTSPALATLLAAFVWWRFCRPEWRRRGQAQPTTSLPTWQLPSSGRPRKEEPDR